MWGLSSERAAPKLVHLGGGGSEREAKGMVAGISLGGVTPAAVGPGGPRQNGRRQTKGANTMPAVAGLHHYDLRGAPLD